MANGIRNCWDSAALHPSLRPYGPAKMTIAWPHGGNKIKNEGYVLNPLIKIFARVLHFIFMLEVLLVISIFSFFIENFIFSFLIKKFLNVHNSVLSSVLYITVFCISLMCFQNFYNHLAHRGKLVVFILTTLLVMIFIVVGVVVFFL